MTRTDGSTSALLSVKTPLVVMLDVPVVSISPDKAADHFGFLGGFFSLDVPRSSALTRERMGWEPTQPGLIVDLEEGHYFQRAESAAGSAA